MADDFDDDLDLASVLVPVTIDSTNLISVTENGVALPEDPNAAWSSATTYTKGQRVSSASTHRVYESLKDANTNHDPTDITNRTNAAGEGTWWQDIGPTNKYAFVDGLISTPTSGASPLVVTIRPGAANGLSLFGLDGDTLAIEWRDAPGGNVIYTTGGDIALEGSMPADYYEYFFAPFKPLTQFNVTDVEPYSSSEVTITVKKSTGLAKIGMLSIGDIRPLGIPQRDTVVSPKTYSYFGEDAFGNIKIVRRPKARPMTMAIAVEFEDADSVLQTIEDVIDIPVAFIGSRAQFHEKLSTFGLVSGSMSYNTFPHRVLNISVKGYI